MSRLRAGDTSVCADPEVLQTFAALLIGESNYDSFVKNGHELTPLKAVTATGMNKDIGEITCAGNYDFGGPNLLMGGKSNARVSFTLRPSVDEQGNYVVEALPIDGNELLTAWLTLKAMSKAKQEEQAETEPTEEPVPQAPAQNYGSAAEETTEQYDDVVSDENISMNDPYQE